MKCPFCNPINGNLILLETPFNRVILNFYPINYGHLLIVPIAHLATLNDLTEEVSDEMMTLAIKAGGIMQNIVFPQGYNMLMNLGKVAGQTIPHIHMHLIPRFEGDGLRNLGRENQASPRPEITQEAIEKIKRYFPPVMRHEQ